MNGVLGMLDLLSDSSSLSAEDRSIVDTVRASSVSLLELLNSVLEFSKLGTGHTRARKSPLLLRDVVQQSTSLLLPLAASTDSHVSVKVAASTPTEVLSDAVRLGQVVSNLLSNAIKNASSHVVVRVVPAHFATSADDVSRVGSTIAPSFMAGTRGAGAGAAAGAGAGAGAGAAASAGAGAGDSGTRSTSKRKSAASAVASTSTAVAPTSHDFYDPLGADVVWDEPLKAPTGVGTEDPDTLPPWMLNRTPADVASMWMHRAKRQPPASSNTTVVAIEVVDDGPGVFVHAVCVVGAVVSCDDVCEFGMVLVGMSEAVQHAIFQPFVQASDVKVESTTQAARATMRTLKSSTSIGSDESPSTDAKASEQPKTAFQAGTGLGLTVVSELATLFEGAVLVNSKVGQGTVFSVRRCVWSLLCGWHGMVLMCVCVCVYMWFCVVSVLGAAGDGAVANGAWQNTQHDAGGFQVDNVPGQHELGAEGGGGQVGVDCRRFVRCVRKGGEMEVCFVDGGVVDVLWRVQTTL